MMYKMHTGLCFPGVKHILLQKAIYTSQSMSRPALTEPISRTNSAGRNFVDFAVQISDGLLDNVVYETREMVLNPS